MRDMVGAADMQRGNLSYFIADRLGAVNSALALNGGWAQVPAGIYFDTPEFTISAWVYPQQVGSWARVIDFSTGSNQDNIVLTLDSNNLNCPYGFIGPLNLEITASSLCLTLNQWQLLTARFDGQLFSIYINGSLTVSGTQASANYSQLPPLNRTQNYVGKSSFNWDGYSHSFIDDLRFYNKSLTQQEIVDLIMMNYDVKNSKTASTTGIIMIIFSFVDLLLKLKFKNKKKLKRQVLQYHPRRLVRASQRFFLRLQPKR